MPSDRNTKKTRNVAARARQCPVCGGRSKKRLYRQSFANVKNVTFLKGYEVVACERCGFVFADRIPSQKEFDRYYEQQSKYETLSTAARKSRQDSLDNGLAFIKPFVNNAGVSVLEIGSGSGDFLQHLRKNGFTNLTALEPSSSSADSIARNPGITAITGTLSKVRSDSTYNLVALITVLEHVVALDGAIQIISRLLENGGLLYIRVPDACRFRDFDDSPFQQFSPEHINYFSAVSAGNLLARHGYSPLGTEEVALRESHDSVLPMVNLMFRKNGAKGEFAPVKDTLSEIRVREYIDRSAAKERLVREKIEPYASSQEPIVVWGVGTHTQMLLEKGPLKQCNIAVFIDSNKQYTGGFFNNVPVYPPSELHWYPHKVLVSSKVFQTEIADYLRNTLKAPNDLILLYEKPAAAGAAGKGKAFDFNDRKPVESSRRGRLKSEKPDVYDKIMNYENVLAKGGSVAIVDILFDFACNMSCAHCCNLKFAKKDRVLTIADLKDFSRQADALGIAQVNISGGEPLVFGNFDDIVAAIDPAKFHISVSTNGQLLTKEKAAHLKSIGVDKVKISIDSIDEVVYVQTRRNRDAYHKAVDALFFAKEAGLQVSVQTVISHQTARTDATERLAKFCQENGFNFDIMIAKAIGRWEGNEQVLIDREDADHLLNLRKKYSLVQRDVFPAYGSTEGGCVAVRKTLLLTKYGDILPCGFIHISIGNIFQEPLKDIIERGFSLRFFRKRHPICLSGEDRNFVRKYMRKFYGKPLPVHWSEVFTDEDFVK